MVSIKKRVFGFLILLSVSLHGNGFKKDPWIEQWLQFRFEPSFLYRKYPFVNGAINPSSYSSNDRFTQIDMAGVVYPNTDLELLIEFADTKKQRLGTQSVGGQLAYQLLDDYVGDMLSYTPLVNIRFVSSRSLKDVSCIYHYNWNFEVGQAIGKEWSFGDRWIFKPYLFLGVGQANKGSPWLKTYINLAGSYNLKHSLELICDGYFGLGKNHFVNINSFNGYAQVHHQSIDLGLKYKFYISQVFGDVSLSYYHRVFAKNFPSDANSFEFIYSLPFSFF
jgi:hypothetical protein